MEIYVCLFQILWFMVYGTYKFVQLRFMGPCLYGILIIVMVFNIIEETPENSYLIMVKDMNKINYIKNRKHIKRNLLFNHNV